MADQSKKLSQEELRRLMKETAAANKTRITSTYAKYNTLDQLTCTLCCTVIKSDKLWKAHLLSRIHKQKLENLATSSKLPTKRQREETLTQPVLKKQKLEAAVDLSPKFSLETTGTKGENIVKHSLSPHEFNVKKLGSEGGNKGSNTTARSTAKNKEPKASIPVGFFDDPKLDAKVRNVPFKDKMEEELAKFHEEIRKEIEISEETNEEEYEETRLTKEIELIDEQMRYWMRLNDLREKTESFFKAHVNTKPQEKVEVKEDDDDDDDDDVDDYYSDECAQRNWRNKTLF